MALSAETGAAQASDDATLVYVIYFSRHGVRSPTGKPEQYDRYSSAPWPQWPVPPGNLTPHGFELMRLFGSYDRMDLRSRGLLTGEGCADSARVTVHADSDQRTRETGRALAEGMFPGCRVPVQTLAEGTNDPLFHQAPGSISAAASARGVAAIRGRIGDDPGAVAEAYHAQLQALDDVLKDCGPKLAEHSRQSIFDIPASITAGTGDHVAEMRGPLNTAATLSENLLLEYTEGLGLKDVGWSCVDAEAVRRLIDLHTAAFDLAQRTPAVADVQAAALLSTIERSLEQAVAGKHVDGAEGRPGDQALLLVGHDTNLANLAGALGLDWLAEGRRNDTPPGSALVFELWKQPGKPQYAIRTYFTAQTLDQMRQATPLSGGARPARVPVFVPACGRSDNSCSLDAFLAAIRATQRAGF